jgi:probable DNA metabolism protein
MPDRSNIAYLYDGSFDGFLCCIFESFQQKELPLELRAPDEKQMTLFKTKQIETDAVIAQRVREGIAKKASGDVLDMVEYGFYTCVPQKERLILDFVWLCMKHGKKTLLMLTDDTVNALQTAVNALVKESHLLLGFVRFSDYNGVLVAAIKPKNYVLPLMVSHFCDRYANETFMIYDMTHADALLYRQGQSAVLPVFGFSEPEAGENELRFRSLWKLFYDTIAIDSRYNPKCRMTHMPKRYWERMTEMNEHALPPAKAKEHEPDSNQKLPICGIKSIDAPALPASIE